MKIFGNTKYYSERDLANEGFGSIGKNVLISEKATIIGESNIFIGDNVRIDDFNLIQCSRGKLEIGSNVEILSFSSLICHFGVKIGDMATISHGVRIFTASADLSGEFHTNPFPEPGYQNPLIGSINIGNHAFIGANSVVMPSVNMGEGAVLGTLSLAKEDLMPWCIYAGVPARMLKERSHSILNKFSSGSYFNNEFS